MRNELRASLVLIILTFGSLGLSLDLGPSSRDVSLVPDNWSVTEADLESAECQPQTRPMDESPDDILARLERLGIGVLDPGKIGPPFSVQELHAIERGMGFLPTSKLPLNIPGQIRLTPGLRAIANAALNVGVEWRFIPDWLRVLSIVHEFGHRFGFEAGNLEQSAEWKKLSLNDAGTQVDPAKAASIYGQKNVEEDFAESFAAYRLASKRFRAEHPEKYEYLKTKIFSGVEYLDSSQCNQSR